MADGFDYLRFLFPMIPPKGAGGFGDNPLNNPFYGADRKAKDEAKFKAAQANYSPQPYRSTYEDVLGFGSPVPRSTPTAPAGTGTGDGGTPATSELDKLLEDLGISGLGGGEALPVPPMPTEDPGEGRFWDLAKDAFGNWTWVPEERKGFFDEPRDQGYDFLRKQELEERQRQFNESEKNRREDERRKLEFQRDKFQWEQEQATARLELEQKNALAQLRANPASWLEYAVAAGEQPVVQPWMQGLLTKQDRGLQVGQNIPGFNPEGGDLSSLPELLNPSAQYLSRLAPSQRSQFAGYRQARTGQTPADVDFFLGNLAPPGGRTTELTRTR